MSVEIKAPAFPESIADGTIATWHKKEGDRITRDELVVDIETDKVVIEVVAPVTGILSKILHQEDDVVQSGEVIGVITEGDASGATPSVSEDATAKASTEQSAAKTTASDDEPLLSPAARKIIEENALQVSQIKGTGKDGRITKEDALNAVSNKSTPAPAVASNDVTSAVALSADGLDERAQRRVPMTRLRARIAERLLAATQEAAMLTTFNEVDMSAIMALRSKYKDEFEKQHNGTRLGFMSFFVRAAVEALKRHPVVNASIDGSDIVYHGYQDVGVAVSTERGLVVPVLRDTDSMSLAEIEQGIRELGTKAKEGKLSLDDMTGGTFTITNGGVFGSLLSTPILNPPQSAILGMHTIQDRPVARNGEVVIRPMMYLALSYDHRLVDGKEAVGFLVEVKELLEEPARILLNL